MAKDKLDLRQLEELFHTAVRVTAPDSTKWIVDPTIVQYGESLKQRFITEDEWIEHSSERGTAGSSLIGYGRNAVMARNEPFWTKSMTDVPTVLEAKLTKMLQDVHEERERLSTISAITPEEINAMVEEVKLLLKPVSFTLKYVEDA